MSQGDIYSHAEINSKIVLKSRIIIEFGLDQQEEAVV